ncbi:MAG TPA: amidohydrolase [Paracoccus sp. (in: a-proteobacteria)]|uniref:amidohydrolase n=1 Tax=uncultured Paracoccus sp. TaxID=189685 RepID=UPI0026098E92|nr:amidohydrolase [uncultured Paracoccus sp.]HMQ42484.1 amidohydrolase [Paracoccus sp. (in: a-proteobacteria)]HMR37606.1 amidohydrolase [Paracoccus sp. (in: a-proteobacteria)]
MKRVSNGGFAVTALTGSLCLALLAGAAHAQDSAIDASAAALEQKVIDWRRDIHQHPELGNRETRTAGLVAEHLKALGFEVREGIAATGVIGILRGGKPGPVVALRADMDALPVTEDTGLPFASTVRTTYNGEEVGVMHACGHDGHTAILMGVAEALAGMKDDLAGTIMVIFQPAEEGAPEGETGGAQRMLAEGAFDDPTPDAVFGLHLMSGMPTGQIGYREGPILASSDGFHVHVKGEQTHGAMPWNGVDPIVLASQIVLGFQTIQSRQVDVTNQPSVLTVGTFDAGTRANIVPDEAVLTGTLRTYDEDMRAFIKQRMQDTAGLIAQSGQGSAEVSFLPGAYATTVNDPELTQAMEPTLQSIPGVEAVVVPKRTPSEDFSFFAQEVPGLFLFVGATPPDGNLAAAAPNHSPQFVIDEASLLVGMRTLLHLTLDYMEKHPAKG